MFLLVEDTASRGLEKHRNHEAGSSRLSTGLTERTKAGARYVRVALVRNVLLELEA